MKGLQYHMQGFVVSTVKHASVARCWIH